MVGVLNWAASQWDLVKWILTGVSVLASGFWLFLVNRQGVTELLLWMSKREAQNEKNASDLVREGVAGLAAGGDPAPFLTGVSKWLVCLARRRERRARVVRALIAVVGTVVTGLVSWVLMTLTMEHTWGGGAILASMVSLGWAMIESVPIFCLITREGIPMGSRLR